MIMGTFRETPAVYNASLSVTLTVYSASILIPPAEINSSSIMLLTIHMLQKDDQKNTRVFTKLMSIDIELKDNDIMLQAPILGRQSGLQSGGGLAPTSPFRDKVILVDLSASFFTSLSSSRLSSWRLGYIRTSIGDLARVLNLTRSSIINGVSSLAGLPVTPSLISQPSLSSGCEIVDNPLQNNVLGGGECGRHSEIAIIEDWCEYELRLELLGLPNTFELLEVRITVRGLTEFTDGLMITNVDHSVLHGQVQADTRGEAAETKTATHAKHNGVDTNVDQLILSWEQSQWARVKTRWMIIESKSKTVCDTLKTEIYL